MKDKKYSPIDISQNKNQDVGMLRFKHESTAYQPINQSWIKLIALNQLANFSDIIFNVVYSDAVFMTCAVKQKI